jgi:hypothetical protein
MCGELKFTFTLGLTVFDGMAHMYEKNLSKEERKQLLLNPADTLLEPKLVLAYVVIYLLKFNLLIAFYLSS